MKKIKGQYDLLKGRQETVKKEILALQAICPHPNSEKKHHRNDSYDGAEFWTNFKCPDCGKIWTEQGSK